jgi:hypothetical protein
MGSQMRYPDPWKNEKSAVIGDSVEGVLSLLLRPPDKTIPDAYFQGPSAPGKGRYRMLSSESKIF